VFPISLAMLLLVTAVAIPAPVAPAQVVRGELGVARLATGAVIPGSYVVNLRAGDPGVVAAEHARFGVRVTQVLRTALRGYTARMSADVARRVAADPRVSRVTPDRVFRAAGRLSGAASTQMPTGIRRIRAPESSAHPGGGAASISSDIAVLDTGVELKHPDLNVAVGVDCVPGTSGYDDERGHGTHIAGTAAAKGTGDGVVGVAPGARIWAVRVLDAAGDGSLATLACGIDWVTAHATTIKVANMSLVGRDTARDSSERGTSEPDKRASDTYQGCHDGALHEAICRSVAAGVVYTVAAGNDGVDAADYTPAAYPEVIAVGALADYDGRPGGLGREPADCPGGPDDQFANFSDYGAPVALIAPGVCIRSTWINDGYATLTGTSQAAAYVAGAVALYRSTHPSASPAQVREALITAASKDWVTSSAPDHRAYGLLDVSTF
jgi:subtilisin family serine protease